MKKWERKFARGDRVKALVAQNMFVGEGEHGTVIGTWTEGFKGDRIGGFRVVFDCLIDNPQSMKNYDQVGTSTSIDSIEKI